MIGIGIQYGQAPGFLPSSLSGMKLWLRADMGVTADGSNRVSAWADQSGNGNNFTQGGGSSKPLYVASGLNGLPHIDFNQATSHLAGPALSALMAASGKTVVIVYTVDTASTTGAADAYLGNGVMGQSTEYFGVGVTTSGGSVRVLASTYPSAWKTAFFSIAPAPYSSALFVFHDGVTLGVEDISLVSGSIGAGATGSLTATTYLGRNSTPNYFDGKISEVITYNRQVSGAEYTALRGYINGRYGF